MWLIWVMQNREEHCAVIVNLSPIEGVNFGPCSSFIQRYQNVICQTSQNS